MARKTFVEVSPVGPSPRVKQNQQGWLCDAQWNNCPAPTTPSNSTIPSRTQSNSTMKYGTNHLPPMSELHILCSGHQLIGNASHVKTDRDRVEENRHLTKGAIERRDWKGLSLLTSSASCLLEAWKREEGTKSYNGSRKRKKYRSMTRTYWESQIYSQTQIR